MKRLILSAAFAALTVVNPAFATDIINMSDTERDVFRAEVRAYLLENPEVLMEAIHHFWQPLVCHYHATINEPDFWF